MGEAITHESECPLWLPSRSGGLPNLSLPGSQPGLAPFSVSFTFSEDQGRWCLGLGQLLWTEPSPSQQEQLWPEETMGPREKQLRVRP